MFCPWTFRRDSTYGWSGASCLPYSKQLHLLHHLKCAHYTLGILWTAILYEWVKFFHKLWVCGDPRCFMNERILTVCWVWSDLWFYECKCMYSSTIIAQINLTFTHITHLTHSDAKPVCTGRTHTGTYLHTQRHTPLTGLTKTMTTRIISSIIYCIVLRKKKRLQNETNVHQEWKNMS